MSTQTKHTPGPWSVKRSGDILLIMGSEEAPDSQNGEVAVLDSCTDDFGFGDEVLANALLIAAAPELLEALKVAKARLVELAVASHHGPYGELATLALIDAAIAKAEPFPMTPFTPSIQ